MKYYNVKYKHRLNANSGGTIGTVKVKANSVDEAIVKAVEYVRKSLGQPNRIVEIISVEEV
ncbi:Uncharacterised protein [Actinobacillus lignieresii]|uniref:hypothetical protein n=1 Tax=Actinobacillus lignieresii TaxID=720 RepID=UPI000F6D2BA4|nr:hypothetical protein [Actinobacillus lignieresii]VEB25748.1 Uncharacterised protein [Actinobacillus lignieresii]